MRTPRPVRDDQRQRLLSGGCGEQLAEPRARIRSRSARSPTDFGWARPTRIAPAPSVKTRPAS